MNIQDSLSHCIEKYAKKPGVVGVGRGQTAQGKDCITILLQDLNSGKDLPDDIEGIPILKKEVGTINAGDTS